MLNFDNYLNAGYEQSVPELRPGRNAHTVNPNQRFLDVGKLGGNYVSS
jgi:hypothetical protein